MTPAQQKEVVKAFAKAKESLENADHDLQGGFLLAVANRAYYCSYYCMTALLLTRDVIAKTHQGTRSKFSELFIKTGEMSLDLSEWLGHLFDARQEADYDLDAVISSGEALLLIQKAKNILFQTKQYLDTLEDS